MALRTRGAAPRRVHHLLPSRCPCREGRVPPATHRLPHWPLGANSPELRVTGLLKAKQQDVVVLLDGSRPVAEEISDGPLAGSMDMLGRATSERAIIVGVRSQLSSLANNYDTMMERAFAETLNMRLRMPKLIMGEVFLIPAYEYDAAAMVHNSVTFRPVPVNVGRYIDTFIAISGQTLLAKQVPREAYMYDRSALLIVDFRQSPPRVFRNTRELVDAGLVSRSYKAELAKLSPYSFSRDLLAAHEAAHGPSISVTNSGAMP
jgi:hypothetical protein